MPVDGGLTVPVAVREDELEVDEEEVPVKMLLLLREALSLSAEVAVLEGTPLLVDTLEPVDDVEAQPEPLRSALIVAARAESVPLIVPLMLAEALSEGDAVEVAQKVEAALSVAALLGRVVVEPVPHSELLPVMRDDKLAKLLAVLVVLPLPLGVPNEEPVCVCVARLLGDAQGVVLALGNGLREYEAHAVGLRLSKVLREDEPQLDAKVEADATPLDV